MLGALGDLQPLDVLVHPVLAGQLVTGVIVQSAILI